MESIDVLMVGVLLMLFGAIDSVVLIFVLKRERESYQRVIRDITVQNMVYRRTLVFTYDFNVNALDKSIREGKELECYLSDEQLQVSSGFVRRCKAK